MLRPMPISQQEREAEQSSAREQEGVPGTLQRRLHLGDGRPGGDAPAGHLRPVEGLQRNATLEVGGGDDTLGPAAVLAQRFLRHGLADETLRQMRARHVDVLAVGHGREPAFRQLRCLQQLDQPLGIERHDQRVGNLLAHAHGHAHGKDQPPRHGALEQVRDIGLPGAQHDIGNHRLGLRADRQAGPERQARVDLLLARAVDQDHVPGRPRAQRLQGLHVERHEILGGQRRRGGERLQRGDDGGDLAVDVGAQGAGDGERAALVGGALRLRVAMQDESAVEQDRNDDRQAEDDQIGAQAELDAAPLPPSGGLAQSGATRRCGHARPTARPPRRASRAAPGICR